MASQHVLETLSKQFRYYQQLGEHTFVQLSDEQLFWRPSMQTNSIAIIVYHLSGNMKSRFTDFLISDGEKPWRHRDQEFDDPPYDRILMLKTWTAGWDCLWAALESIREEDRDRLVSIRNVQHTLTEAFLRQLAHYSYHVGQIVQLGVMQKKEEWQSLSIPKGASEQYNAKAFAQAKCRGHFTDDLLK